MKKVIVTTCVLLMALPALAVLTAGCSGGDEEKATDKTGRREAPRRRIASGERSTPSPAAATGGAMTIAYTEDESITGNPVDVQVTWAGNADTLTSLSPLPTNGVDASACTHHGDGVEGAKLPNTRLVVDPASKGVKNALVFLTDISKGKPWNDSAAPKIDQKNCIYLPEVTVVKVGGDVDVTSSDPVTHTVRFFYQQGDSEAMTADLNFPAGSSEVKTVEVKKPGVYKLRCNAGHNWMDAVVFASTNPYVGITDASGKVTLADVPDGKYTLQVMHQSWNFMTTASAKGAPSFFFDPMLVTTVPVEVSGGKVEIKLGLSEDGFAVQ